jgi:hypothetical protein
VSVSYIAVCKSFAAGVCEAQEYVQGYVLPASAGDQIDLLFQGGFSAQGFSLGFSAMISLFVIGAGIGLIISVLRKLKR